KSGQLRALAVTTATPQPDLLPGLPTVGQFVPGFEAAGWQGLCAPSQTPPEIVDRLNREVNAILADGPAKARLARPGRPTGPAAPGQTSASSARTRPTNGARWSARPASSRIERLHSAAPDRL